MSQMIDERAFTPMFLEACSDLELVALQYELRRFPEDRPYLTQVLDELGRRPQAAESTNGEGES